MSENRSEAAEPPVKHYKVEWVIDIYAATPEEAAREALAIQRDPNSLATVFEVTDDIGVSITIDLAEAGPAPPGAARYTARFAPQIWQRDYAIEVHPLGPTEFDVTAEVLAMTPSQRAETLRGSAENDDLRYAAAAPTWVRVWYGPFEVYVEEAPQTEL